MRKFFFLVTLCFFRGCSLFLSSALESFQGACRNTHSLRLAVNHDMNFLQVDIPLAAGRAQGVRTPVTGHRFLTGEFTNSGHIHTSIPDNA